MKTNVLSQPQTLRAVLMADTFASSKHLRGLHATHANVTTVHSLYIRRFRGGRKTTAHTTGNKLNAKSGRQEERSFKDNRKRKSQKQSRKSDYSVHQIRFLKACFQNTAD